MNFALKSTDPPESEINMALQGLPPDMAELAREAGAHLRARVTDSPESLIRAVFLYCGLDQSLREAAATFTPAGCRITDEGIRKRLNACTPWVRMLLSRMLPAWNLNNLPEGLCFYIFDATSVQAPGATGTDYRIHTSINLITLEVIDIKVTDWHTGETLKHFNSGKGNVLIADRGYCNAGNVIEKQKEGSDVVIRYNHASMPLYHKDGAPLSLAAELKRAKKKGYISIPVQAGPKDGEKAAGWIHAAPLPPEQAEAARRRCHENARKDGRTPSVETLFLAGYLIILLQYLRRCYPYIW